jgi:hypothetical protein
MPETCRVLQQNKIWIISGSGWLFKNKSITMHGNMTVKFINGSIHSNYTDGSVGKVTQNQLVCSTLHSRSVQAEYIYVIIVTL